MQPLRFEPDTAGQALTLPRRRYGKGAFALLLLTAFGLVFAGLPGYFLTADARDTFNQHGTLPWTSLLPALFALPFVAIGLALALGPWLALLVRTTIRLVGDELLVRDHLGPFGWTRRRAINDLHGFKIDVGSSSTNDGPAKPMKNFATLTADCGEGAMPFVIAAGYPRALVNELANTLADKLQTHGRLGPERELTVTESISGIDDDIDDPSATADAPEVIPPQPDTSTIMVKEHAAGVSYYLPPRGVWKGSRGLMFFAVLWNGFITVFIAITLISGKQPTYESSGQPVPWYIVALLMGLFVAIGAALLLGALHAGKRRAILDISRTPVGPALLIARESIFGKKTTDLPPGHVTAIDVGPSGTKVNDQPVYHLKISLSQEAQATHPKRKNPLGLFAERDDEELRWLAARLRHDLHVGKSIR